MFSSLGKYDGSLHMFVATQRDVDLVKLAFLRWLVEQGKLEHRIAGPPSGEFADCFIRTQEGKFSVKEKETPTV